MNHGALVMLDLSAAFDTIDHDILFHQFEHDFGVKGTALQWFKSYMTGRSFKVSISGEMSNDFPLDFGVPQGSIIGPRAFTKYAQYMLLPSFVIMILNITCMLMTSKFIILLIQRYQVKLCAQFIGCPAV